MNGKNIFPNSGTVFYQVFVRSFFDGNGDGRGDLKGLTEKLDYIKNLGADAIWLMPIHPSPSYHGYNVSNYDKIHPDYGTMKDFDRLIKEAHKRDMKIVIDFVVNHTSASHEWFQKAVAGDNFYKNFYISSDKKVNDNYVLQKDGKYYLYEFGPGSDMPSLNYDEQKVRDAVRETGKFWVKKGIDGFRLDVAQMIYSYSKERTITWWIEFSDYVRTYNKNLFIVGEVNFEGIDDSPLIAPYLKGMNSAFNFPLYNIITAHSSMDLVLTDFVQFTGKKNKIYSKYNPAFVDSVIIGNHDRVRFASEIDGNILKLKKAAVLQFTMPGIPFIYYGDELGMKGGGGNQGDPNKREPFDWYESGKGAGMTVMDPEIYGRTSMNIQPDDGISIEEQSKDPESLYNFYRQLIMLRKKYPVLGAGVFEPIGTPGGTFGYRITSEGLGYKIYAVHNQSFTKGCEIKVKGECIDLLTNKIYPKDSLVQVGTFSSILLKSDSIAPLITDYPTREVIVPEATLTIQIHVPDSTPERDVIYVPHGVSKYGVSGWNCATELKNDPGKLDYFIAKKSGKNTYSYTVKYKLGTKMEFKVYRGDWERCEATKDGLHTSNRVYSFSKPGSHIIDEYVDRWLDQ